MKQVTVVRSRWVRGNLNGEVDDTSTFRSQLLNHQGNKCCLGFAICQISRHIPTCRLLSKGDPFRIFERASFLTELDDVGEVKNNKFSNKAIGINDNTEITEKVRERRLTKLFRTNGINLKFVD